MRESDIEEYLVNKVREAGGGIRKVKWLGRWGAPDRLVLLPPEEALFKGRNIPNIVWVEVKAPGKKATFPAGARERAQAREHARMRCYGLRVEVIDSFEDVDRLVLS